MNLLAVLGGNNIVLCGTSICTQNDSIPEDNTNDGSACLRCFRRWETLLYKKGISVEKNEDENTNESVSGNVPNLY